jgi:hypothetical protein
MDDFFDAFKPKPKYEHTTKVVHFRKEECKILYLVVSSIRTF